MTGKMLVFGLVMFCFSWFAREAVGSGQRGSSSPSAGMSRGTTATSTGRSGPEHDLPRYHSMDCKIIDIDTDYGTIAVEDKKGNRMQFIINKKTRLKADKQTDLADKKKIELADFKNGQRVTVTFQLGGKTATEVKLRRSEG